jgi:hypothetical protein
MAATLINPYGPVIYKDIVSRLISPSVNVIDIFKSPDFHDGYVLSQGMWMLLLWIGILISTRRPSATDLALAVAFSLLFLDGQRYFIFLLIATLPVAARHWGIIGSGFQRPAWKAAVLTGCILGGTFFLMTPRHFKGIYDDLTSAANFMKEAGVRGHVFNHYTWGGFLLWEHPEMNIFIDGRNNIYEESGVFSDYRAAARGARQLKKIFDIYDINAVIWPRWETALYKIMSKDPGWEPLYKRGEAAVFLRATPENMPILEKYRVMTP